MTLATVSSCVWRLASWGSITTSMLTTSVMSVHWPAASQYVSLWDDPCDSPGISEHTEWHTAVTSGPIRQEAKTVMSRCTVSISNRRVISHVAVSTTWRSARSPFVTLGDISPTRGVLTGSHVLTSSYWRHAVDLEMLLSGSTMACSRKVLLHFATKELIWNASILQGVQECTDEGMLSSAKNS